MSTTVDERVVEMTFDNKQFEKNVKESMSTIDKLKKKLNFKGMKDGLDDFQESASKFDLDEMEKAADSVSIKFSALEAAGLRVIQRITDAAFDAGVSMVKSLSVDNIAAGWDKFKDKTTSVATLISQGYDMDTVNAQLERLNWFTDETSYNFTEMVSSISKFTASGQDLEQSVDAMEGIATWAALSGQNATTASRAMYQLSQAMGSGQMRKQDWMSIQNANMDTEEFRQKAIDAAVALGNLEKIDEDLYISTLGGKNVTPFKVSQFADHLTEDAWFTSDVMMAVFQDYSAAVDQLYEYTEETGKTASEAIEDLGDQLDAFGLKAFKAAQEAKTWTDVVDSVKDAVGTGWMNTFENIFGDYEEQRVLWTDLANELYYIFAESGNERNEILADWKELKGRELIFANDLEHGNIGAFWNIFYAFKDFIDNIKESFRNVFPKKTAEELYDIAENIKTFSEKLRMSEETSEKFRNVLYQFFSAIKGIGNIIGYIYKVLAKPIITKIFDMLPIIGNKFIIPIYRALNTLYGVIDGIVNDFGSQFKDVISDISGAAKGTISLSSIIEKIGKIIATIIGYAATLLWQIHESELAISIIKGIAKVITTIFDIIKALFDLISGKSKWSDFVSSFAEIGKNIVVGLGNGIKNAFNIVVEVIKAFANFVINTFKSILGIHSPSTVFEGFGENIGQGLINGIKKIASYVVDAFLWLGGKIIDAFNAIVDFLVNIDIFGKIQTGFSKLVSGIKTVGSWISSAFEAIFGKSISDMFSDFGNAISKSLDKTKEAVSGFGNIDTSKMSKFGEKIKSIFHPISSLFSGLLSIFKALWNGLGLLFDILSPVFDKIGELFSYLGNSISAFIKQVDSTGLKDLISTILVGYLGFGVGEITDGIGKTVLSFGEIMQDFEYGIEKLTKRLDKVLKSITEVFRGFALRMTMDGIADILTSLGKAILEIAIAIGILSLIDANKLKSSATIIIAVLTEMIGAILGALGIASHAANKDVKKGKTSIKKLMEEAVLIKTIGKLLVKMALAIIIIAVAAKIVDSIDDTSDALMKIGEIMAALMLAVAACIELTKIKNVTPKRLENLTKLMKKIASAVLILALTAVVMKIVKWDDLYKVGAALAGFAGVVFLFGFALTKTKVSDKKLIAATKSMTTMAGAILVITLVAILMKLVSWTDLAKVGVALVGFAGIMFVFGLVLTKTKVSESKIVKATGAMAAMAGAILVLALAGFVMNLVSWPALAKTGIALVVFAGVMFGFAVGISKLTDSSKKLGKAMIAAAIMVGLIAALTLIAFAMTIVTWESLAKVGVALVVFVGVLLGFIAILSKIKITEKKLLQVETLMAIMLGVIFAIGLIAKIMANVGWGDLGKVGAVLLGLIAGLTAICLLPKLVSGSALEKFGAGLLKVMIAIAAFGVGIALFAGGLYLLSQVSDEGVAKIKDILTQLVLFIPEFIAAVITGLIDAVTMIANKLPELKDDILLIISTIIELLVRAIADNTILIVDSVLNLIFTVITKIGEYSYKITSALFDILIGVVKATFDRLPELIENIANIFMNVVTILSDVFNDMDAADFLAAIAVSEGMKLLFESMLVTFAVGTGLSYLLVECADNLVIFGEKITPFLDMLSSYDPKIIESAKNLAETILMFTGSSILDAIGSFVGGKDIAAFGEEFAKLGPGLVKFGESVKDVDADTIQKASIAAQSITAFVNDIPREGGLLQKVIGEIDFKGFAEGLAEFGPAFASYAQSVEGIDKATIQNSTEAAMFITKFAKSIPNTGGLLAQLLGDNTLDEFGRQLLSFGPAFATYALMMVGIPVETVKASSEAALTVAKFAKEVPNNGGALAKLLGDNRLDDFGEQLSVFGPAFAEYAKKMRGINKATVQVSTEAATLVAKFAKEVPNSGGALSWLVGDNRLDSFGAQLPKFGEGFAGFITALDGVEVNLAKVSMCQIVASMMAALENNLPRTGGVVQWFIGQKDLGQFGKQLTAFGTGMASYMNSISGADYDTEKVNASVEVALALSKINEKTSILSTLISWITGETALSQLGEGLIPLAEGMSEYMNSISNADFDKEKIVASVNAAVALSSINDHTSALSALVEWFTGDTAYEKLATSMPSLAEGLVGYGTAIKDAGFTLSDFIRIGKSADIVVALSKINDHKTALQTLAEWITGKDVYESLSEGMPKLAEGLVDYGNTIYKGNFDDTKLSNSADIISKLAGAYSTVTSGFDIFDWLISHKESDLEVFAKNLPNLAKGITEYAKIIQTATVSVNTPDTISQTKIKNLGQTMQTYDEAYGIIAKSVSFDSKDIEASIEAITSLSKLVNLKSAWGELVDWITGNDIGKQFKQISDGLVLLGRGAAGFVSETAFLFSRGTILANDGKNYEEIIVDKSEQFLRIVQGISEVADIALSDQYMQLLSNANQLFKMETMTLLGQDLKGFYDQVKDFTSTKLNNAKTILNWIETYGTSTEFKTASGQMAMALVNIGKNAVKNLYNGMDSAGEDVAILTKIMGYITDYYSGRSSRANYPDGKTPYEQMIESGKYLIMGFAGGLEDPEAISAISGASTHVFGIPKNVSKEMIQWNSPSKVFHQIGKYVTEGMALGIVDNEGVNMLTSSIAKICDIVQNDVDAQPTIRPVMDLTEIQNGVKLANSVTAGLNGAYVTGSYNMASDTAYRANLRQAELNNASNVSVASEVGRILGEVVASNGTTFNNTFNITGDDPEEIAEEVSRIIQQDMERRNAVWA